MVLEVRRLSDKPLPLRWMVLPVVGVRVLKSKINVNDFFFKKNEGQNSQSKIHFFLMQSVQFVPRLIIKIVQINTFG